MGKQINGQINGLNEDMLRGMNIGLSGKVDKLKKQKPLFTEWLLFLFCPFILETEVDGDDYRYADFFTTLFTGSPFR